MSRFRIALCLGLTVVALGLVTHACQASDGRQTVRKTNCDSITVAIQVDRVTARVADPINVSLRVEAPTGTTVVMPTIESTLGPFQVQMGNRQEDVPVLNSGGKSGRRWVQHFQIDTIETGSCNLPSLRVQYRLPEVAAREPMQVCQSEPLSIQIASVLKNEPNGSQFRGFKEVVDLESVTAPEKQWISWAIGILMVVLILILVIGFVAIRRRPEPLSVQARRELESLRQSRQDPNLQRKALFCDVTELVRTFLATRYGPELAAQTTTELVQHLTTQSWLPAETSTELNWLLETDDALKFGGKTVETVLLDRAFDTASEVIQIPQESSGIASRGQ